MGRMLKQLIDSIVFSIPMLVFGALVLIWCLSMAGCTSKKNTTIEMFPDVIQERQEPVVTPSPAPSQREQAPAPVLTPETVYFGFDRFNLTDDACDALDAIAGLIGASDQGLLVITGGACPIGDEQYNSDLGYRRALAVKNYLRRAGVGMETEIRSFGESNLVALSPADYWRNRRVEIEVR